VARPQRADGGVNLGRPRAAVILRRLDELGVELHLRRAQGAGTKAPAADVPRDGEKPRARALGPVAAAERAVGVQERHLRDVLGLVWVAEIAQERAVHARTVRPVQSLERRLEFRGGSRLGG
jgi:hypothetical protein